MRRKNRLIATVVILAFITGCMGLQLKESPAEIYYKALGVWFDAGSQFRFYYEKSEDEVLKAKWDEEFRPLLVKAKEVLNLWNFHLQNDSPTANDMVEWKSYKNELIYYIATQMKKEKI